MEVLKSVSMSKEQLQCARSKSQRAVPIAVESLGSAYPLSHSVVCIFFDLETTGLSLQHSEVIEFAATTRILDVSCDQMSNTVGSWRQSVGGSAGVAPDFHALVLPSRAKKLPRKIAHLTGLSDERIRREGKPFRDVATAWLRWLHSVVRISDTKELWLVAHNGLAYDLPLLLAQDAWERQREERSSMGLMRSPMLFEGLLALTAVVDTLKLSRKLAAAGRLITKSHKLFELHRATAAGSGGQQHQAHTALGDVACLAELCASSAFTAAFASAAAAYAGMGAGDAAVLVAVVPVRQALSAARRLATFPIPRAQKSRRRISEVYSGRPTKLKRMSVSTGGAAYQRREKASCPEIRTVIAQPAAAYTSDLSNAALGLADFRVKSDCRSVVTTHAIASDRVRRKRWKRGVLRVLARSMP